MADIFYSSIFGELTKQVQVRIDAASELRKRLFDQNIYERYLTWDVPTIVGCPHYRAELRGTYRAVQPECCGSHPGFKRKVTAYGH